MTSIRRTLAVISVLLIISLQAFADRTGFDGYPDLSIDIPEDMYCVFASENGDSFQLESALLPVSAIVKIYPYGKYGTSQRAMDDTVSRLKLKSTCRNIEWRNQIGTVATLTGILNDRNIAGYGVAAVLPYDQGIIVMADWCDSSDKSRCDNLMVSFLDSLCIDAGSYYETGIMTRQKYPDSSTTVPVSLNIAGKTVNTVLNANDRLASQYLIDREYEVLKLYAQSENWQQAWQRYYRMIFRDSFRRLQRPAFDIYSALYEEADDATDLAQKLLTWTQSFKYEREKTSSDFASLPSILLGGGSDCDSRSMLLAVLLTNMNQDAVIFVSAQYSHALAGFVSTHPGHAFSVDGKDYLMGETTAQGLTWGKISADQDNQDNWITVEFQ